MRGMSTGLTRAAEVTSAVLHLVPQLIEREQHRDAADRIRYAAAVLIAAADEIQAAGEVEHVYEVPTDPAALLETDCCQ